MNIPVIIPTLNPRDSIFTVVDGLCAEGFRHIIIINDGSSPEKAPIFDRLRENPACVVLEHEVNRGKGRGLKTGFSYVLEHFGDCGGVVTTDDDGQHTPADIRRCAERMLQSGKVILGARDFSGDNVPPKSKFGNNMTRFVFRALCGIKITDTQTGLRAIPTAHLPAFIELSGERFEYETNMLLEMKRLSIPFEEERIETIYSDNNSGTHFNPFKDSIKIYLVIIKFMLSSFACSLIDIALFTVLNFALAGVFGENEWGRVFAATAGARVVSSLVNFFINKKGVFRSDKPIARTIVKYYVLCVAQFALSSLIVSGLSVLFGAERSLWQTLIKLVTDTVLFFVSFGIQRDWVYK